MAGPRPGLRDQPGKAEQHPGPQAAYYDYAVRRGEAHDWDLHDGDTLTRNADNQAAGQTYIDLYNIEQDPIRVTVIISSIDNMLASDKIDDWNWIESRGLFLFCRCR